MHKAIDRNGEAAKDLQLGLELNSVPACQFTDRLTLMRGDYELIFLPLFSSLNRVFLPLKGGGGGVLFIF